MTQLSPPPKRRSRSSLKRRLAGAASLFALAGCTPAGLLTQVDRIVAPSAGKRLAQGLAYGPDQRHKLDVWAPANKGGGALPVVVFFYGGGWNSGSRGDFGFAGAAFASRDFIAVIPDYRLVPAARFPTFVEDGALAVRWVRDNVARFGGDPRRISIAGHSSGAYNAAMLALDRRYLQRAGVDPGIIRAAALLAGPYDFYPFTEARGQAAFSNWSKPLETQPITFARGDAPPILLAHGGADRIVFPYNSQRLAKRLEEKGARVSLKLYPNANHIDLVTGLSGTFRHRVPVLSDSAAFLHQHSR